MDEQGLTEMQGAAIGRLALVKQFAKTGNLSTKAEILLYAVAAYAMAITGESQNTNEMRGLLNSTTSILPPPPSHKGCILCRVFGTPGWVLIGARSYITEWEWNPWNPCPNCNIGNDRNIARPSRINCLCWRTGVFKRLDGCPFHSVEAT